jgi:hypothetical protein
MAGKIAVLGTLALLIVTLAIVFSASKNPDLPPGVLAEMWIPINENAGVALNYLRSGGSTLTHGTLMIKSHGSGVTVYLDPGPEKPGFLPVIR